MKKLKKCLLCHGTTFLVLHKMSDRMFSINGEFTWKKCRFCGLAFLDPQPSNTTLRLHYPSKGYFAYNKEGKTGLYGKIREYIIKHTYSQTLFSRILRSITNTTFGIPLYKKDGKIVDVGCGTGDILVLLKDLGWSTYGIDIDKNAIHIAKSRGLINVRFGTYKTLGSYPDNYFDVIRLYHVIEHLDNPLACLQLLYKKIKPGGLIILSTPNFASPIRKLFGTYWSNFDTPRHLFIFTPETLVKAVKLSKLHVVKIEYTSASGIAGSMQHFINTKIRRRVQFFGTLPIVLFFHPIEWILDKLEMGDMFTIQATK